MIMVFLRIDDDDDDCIIFYNETKTIHIELVRIGYNTV